MLKNKTATILLAALLISATPVISQDASAQWNPFSASPSQKDLKDFNAADKLFNSGLYARALIRIEKFLKKYPNDTAGRMLKAWTLLKLDRMDEAKSIIDDVLAKNHEYSDALVALGVYYRKLGENDKALEFYEKALSIDPNDPYAQSSIVTIALLNCQVKKAVHYGELSLKNEANDAVMNANLAVAYHFDKQLEKRDEYTEKARELNYPSMDALIQIYSGELLILPDDCDPDAVQP